MKALAGVRAHRIQSIDREIITAVLDNRFDGDAINFSLAIDNYVSEAYKNLKPHKSVFSLDQPFKVSGNLSMPKPVISTISNFVHTPLTEEDFDPVKIAAMSIIPEYVESIVPRISIVYGDQATVADAFVKNQKRSKDRRQEDRRTDV